MIRNATTTNITANDMIEQLKRADSIIIKTSTNTLHSMNQYNTVDLSDNNIVLLTDKGHSTSTLVLSDNIRAEYRTHTIKTLIDTQETTTAHYYIDDNVSIETSITKIL
ncbi:MAG TPA: hypothetical protein DCE48_05700 [Lachnospiraceae bacterium]|nr:hypothetical protein [Lachnospiraceae bacterium]